jgi:hypothetical protein
MIDNTTRITCKLKARRPTMMLMMARTFSMFSTHVFRRSYLLQGVIAVQLNGERDRGC